MGSSSNTNTSGDKEEEKEDNGKGKDSAEPSFKEGDRVLAYHGPLLYEARVQRIENLDDELRYFVHYLGWNKNWDEWVANDRLLKLTEENVRKQQELEKNQVVDKTIKSGRSTQHKPKGSNDTKADKESRGRNVRVSLGLSTDFGGHNSKLQFPKGKGKKIIRESPSVTVSFDTEEATCG